MNHPQVTVQDEKRGGWLMVTKLPLKGLDSEVWRLSWATDNICIQFVKILFDTQHSFQDEIALSPPVIYLWASSPPLRQSLAWWYCSRIGFRSVSALVLRRGTSRTWCITVTSIIAMVSSFHPQDKISVHYGLGSFVCCTCSWLRDQ